MNYLSVYNRFQYCRSRGAWRKRSSKPWNANTARAPRIQSQSTARLTHLGSKSNCLRHERRKAPPYMPWTLTEKNTAVSSCPHNGDTRRRGDRLSAALWVPSRPSSSLGPAYRSRRSTQASACSKRSWRPCRTAETPSWTASDSELRSWCWASLTHRLQH